MKTSPDDCMYDWPADDHTSGGVLAIGAVLIGGGHGFHSREIFGRREFWMTLVRHRCTLSCISASCCRYLVNCPPTRKERAHRLRCAAAMACGPTSGRNSNHALQFR